MLTFDVHGRSWIEMNWITPWVTWVIFTFMSKKKLKKLMYWVDMLIVYFYWIHWRYWRLKMICNDISLKFVWNEKSIWILTVFYKGLLFSFFILLLIYSSFLTSAFYLCSVSPFLLLICCYNLLDLGAMRFTCRPTSRH